MAAVSILCSQPLASRFQSFVQLLSLLSCTLSRSRQSLCPDSFLPRWDKDKPATFVQTVDLFPVPQNLIETGPAASQQSFSWSSSRITQPIKSQDSRSAPCVQSQRNPIQRITSWFKLQFVLGAFMYSAEWHISISGVS
jgi:hypothetical protein